MYDAAPAPDAGDAYTERVYGLVRDLGVKDKELADDLAYLHKDGLKPEDLTELKGRADGYRTFSSYLKDDVEGDITGLMADKKAARDKQYGSQMSKDEINEAYELMCDIDGGNRTLKLHEWERKDGSKGSRRGYTENAMLRSLGFDTFQKKFGESSHRDDTLTRIDGYLDELDRFEIPAQGPSYWERLGEYGEKFLDWGKAAYETGKDIAVKGYHVAADGLEKGYAIAKDAAIKGYHLAGEGLSKGWEATKRSAKAFGEGVESTIARIGASYKTDSAARARDLLEYNKTMGEARDSLFIGILQNKAKMQSEVNRIEKETGGAIDNLFTWA
jgi:hypothetical protein